MPQNSLSEKIGLPTLAGVDLPVAVGKTDLAKQFFTELYWTENGQALMPSFAAPIICFYEDSEAQILFPEVSKISLTMVMLYSSPQIAADCVIGWAEDHDVAECADVDYIEEGVGVVIRLPALFGFSLMIVCKPPFMSSR